MARMLVPISPSVRRARDVTQVNVLLSPYPFQEAVICITLYRHALARQFFKVTNWTYFQWVLMYRLPLLPTPIQNRGE